MHALALDEDGGRREGLQRSSGTGHARAPHKHRRRSDEERGKIDADRVLQGGSGTHNEINDIAALTNTQVEIDIDRGARDDRRRRDKETYREGDARIEDSQEADYGIMGVMYAPRWRCW